MRERVPCTGNFVMTTSVSRGAICCDGSSKFSRHDGDGGRVVRRICCYGGRTLSNSTAGNELHKSSAAKAKQNDKLAAKVKNELLALSQTSKMRRVQQTDEMAAHLNNGRQDTETI